MAVMQASVGGGEEGKAFGAPGVGGRTDVLGELERVRSNLAALAQVVEEIRGKVNGHTHGAEVSALEAGEQAQTAYTMH
jgi:hypothetical protein